MKTKLIPFDYEKAKAGAKVITRCGYPVTIIGCNSNKKYPIRAIIKTEDGPFTFSFTVEGKYCVDEEEHELDFFIEEEDVEAEEEEEVEETDYDPYKATVESIADMAERYADDDSDLKDFYDNVKVQCREAIEYDKKWCKKQDEKPDDNKPKFHKDDWIVQENVGIYKVTEICKSWYEVIDSKGGHYSISFDQESMCHIWTIQDAKPGDILATKNGYIILIFKNIKSSSGSGFSSYYNYNNFSDYSDFNEGSWDRYRFIPATKEQRNFLFQKMKEAGYEWDFDKKEFHKIEKAKTRRMTNQELSWWLREHPEEHREYHLEGETCICFNYHYNSGDSNEEVDENIRIRRNGGEWMEPVIEIE